MSNCSKYISDKTGTVLFMHRGGKYCCSESWENAYRSIFKTRATIEYIDVDRDFITTRVDAVADAENHSMKLVVPASCGDDCNKIEITYSVAEGITAKEIQSGSGGGDVLMLEVSEDGKTVLTPLKEYCAAFREGKIVMLNGISSSWGTFYNLKMAYYSGNPGFEQKATFSGLINAYGTALTVDCATVTSAGAITATRKTLATS